MTNVVLMAGSGKRFSDAGYKQSKPLIPVSGKAMIIQAVKSMPKADKWVFVIREEHQKEQEVLDTLKSVAKNVTILVDPKPIGQLNSALVAKKYYNNDEPLFVGACDLGMIWDEKEYNKLMKSNADMITWSFTQQPNLTRNPQAWGWLKQDENKKIHGVSVKIPLHEDCFNDFAIVGSFTFKSGKLFLQLAKELIKRGETVKGEYYIDSMIGVAIDQGKKVMSFPVKKYIGWGVPADYEEYCAWEKVIPNIKNHPEWKQKKEFSFWNEYFTKDKK